MGLAFLTNLFRRRPKGAPEETPPSQALIPKPPPVLRDQSFPRKLKYCVLSGTYQYEHVKGTTPGAIHKVNPPGSKLARRWARRRVA